AEDPRFATNPERVARRDELDEALAPLFAAGDAATWVETFLRLGIPASVVHDISEVVAQEQALAREMIVESGVEAVRTAGLPLKLSLTPARIRRPPPSLGADNALLGEARAADAPAD
ncbi:MAG: CoA transferase, partial [Solirubrobacteraceae bacterium]